MSGKTHSGGKKPGPPKKGRKKRVYTFGGPSLSQSRQGSKFTQSKSGIRSSIEMAERVDQAQLPIFDGNVISQADLFQYQSLRMEHFFEILLGKSRWYIRKTPNKPMQFIAAVNEMLKGTKASDNRVRAELKGREIKIYVPETLNLRYPHRVMKEVLGVAVWTEFLCARKGIATG